MPRKTVSKKSFVPSLMIGAFVLLVLAGLAAWAVPSVLSLAATKSLENIAGVPVEVGRFHLSITRPQFTLKELKLFNPKGFPEGEMTVLKQVRGDYPSPPIFGGISNVKNLELEFKEFRLIRNKSGLMNLPALNPFQSIKGNVDTVKITLGEVTFTDLAGDSPAQQNFDLELQKAIYRNVKGIPGVIEIVNWEILKRTGIEEGKPEEPERPVLAELKPIAESLTVGQSAPEPAPAALPGSDPLQLSPSLAPSAPGADEPS